MRMDKTQSLTAKKVVNTYSEEELANIIYEYGEERFSRQIAKNICIARKEKEIETTEELVKIIEKSMPAFAKKEGHPAKRTFQAIRIEVNNEIKPLVGDNVEIQVTDEEKSEAIIEKVEQRKNEIKRPKISNIDQIIFVISTKHPKPDLLMLDKQLALSLIHI